MPMSESAAARSRYAAYMTLLHTAIEFDKIDEVRKLWGLGIDLSAPLKDGEHILPIHLALRCSATKALQFMLSKSVPYDIQSDLGETILHYAVRHSTPDALSILLTNLPHRIDDQDTEGTTALILACKHGSTTMAKLLLDAGSDVNIADEMGCTPLMYAVSPINKSPELLDLLLQQPSVDVNQRNLSGVTALHMAIRARKSESYISKLVEAGASAEGVTLAGSGPLTRAILSSDVKTAETLVDIGADVNAKVEGSGMTPLLVAAACSGRGQSASLVQLLIDGGADPLASDCDGKTVWHVRPAPALHYDSVGTRLAATTAATLFAGSKPAGLTNPLPAICNAAGIEKIAEQLHDNAWNRKKAAILAWHSVWAS